MRSEAGSTEQPGIRTLKRYGWAMTIVPAIIVAVFVAWGVRSVILRGYAELVSTALNGFIGEAYPSGVRLDDAAGRARLDAIMQERVSSGNLGGIRLISADGTILYSTAPGEAGTRAAPDRARATALAKGAVSYSVTSGEYIVPARLRPSVRVVAAVPVKGGVRAIAEIYKPYSFISESLVSSVAAVVLVILTGAAITYALFMLVIWQAERSAATSRRRLTVLSARMDATLADQESSNLGTIQALTALIDARDRYTALHSIHVAQYALALAEEIGCDHDDCVMVERAALVHDIGKVGMPEKVLRKPGGLTSAEWEIVRAHPQVGADIVRSIPFLEGAVLLVLTHHERWDGGGYPSKLAGEEIPLLGRVLAVADAFDAMTTDRPYREALTVQEAALELREGAGSQFDPRVVSAFDAALGAGRVVLLGEAGDPGTAAASGSVA